MLIVWVLNDWFPLSIIIDSSFNNNDNLSIIMDKGSCFKLTKQQNCSVVTLLLFHRSLPSISKGQQHSLMKSVLTHHKYSLDQRPRRHGEKSGGTVMVASSVNEAHNKGLSFECIVTSD